MSSRALGTTQAGSGGVVERHSSKFNWNIIVIISIVDANQYEPSASVTFVSRWYDGDRETTGVGEFERDDDVGDDDEDDDVDDEDGDVDEEDEEDEDGGCGAAIMVATASAIADIDGPRSSKTSAPPSSVSLSDLSLLTVLLTNRSYSSKSSDRDSSADICAVIGDATLASNGGVSDSCTVSAGGTASTVGGSSSNMSNMRLGGCDCGFALGNGVGDRCCSAGWTLESTTGTVTLTVDASSGGSTLAALLQLGFSAYCSAGNVIVVLFSCDKDMKFELTNILTQSY